MIKKNIPKFTKANSNIKSSRRKYKERGEERRSKRAVTHAGYRPTSHDVAPKFLRGIRITKFNHAKTLLENSRQIFEKNCLIITGVLSR